MVCLIGTSALRNISVVHSCPQRSIVEETSPTCPLPAAVESMGMHMATTLTINGEAKSFDAPADMPLLWGLRDILAMTGPKFACGIAHYAAGTARIAGKPVHPCLL